MRCDAIAGWVLFGEKLKVTFAEAFRRENRRHGGPVSEMRGYDEDNRGSQLPRCREMV